MKHRWLKYSNVYIDQDPVMTLTKFMARSTWVAYAFEMRIILFTVYTQFLFFFAHVHVLDMVYGLI